MTLDELDTNRWNSLVKLANAVQAHRASLDAGLPVDGQGPALEKLEQAYVEAHGRYWALLETGFEEEVPSRTNGGEGLMQSPYSRLRPKGEKTGECSY